MDDDDVISQGDDREPSPWPRRLAVIAAVVAVAVGGIVYLTRPGHGRTAASGAHPTPATSSAASASNPGAAPLVEPVPAGPNGIIGHTVPWEDSLRLPITGRQPAWYSPASGRSEAIGGLPADSSGYQFTRVGGGWAVQADAAATTACGDCAGAPRPGWFLADGAQSATARVRHRPGDRPRPAADGGERAAANGGLHAVGPGLPHLRSHV